MKTQKELNAIKEEYETVKRKLAELTEDELRQVSGGGLSENFYNSLSEYRSGSAGHSAY